VVVANSTSPVLLDTGSADTWLLDSKYQCLSPVGLPQPRSACGYSGPTYTPASTFKPIPNQFMAVAYGGRVVDGAIGTESVTLAGLTATNQTIGAMTRTTSDGRGFGSGLLGLGYKGATSARNGTQGAVDPATYGSNRTLYTPLFDTLVEQHGIDPFFSIALERDDADAKGGWLALGGLPPVTYDKSWARCDALIPPLPLNQTDGRSVRTWWLLEVDGVKSAGQEVKFDRTLAIVDSGNFVNYLAPRTAEAVAKDFSPPGVWNATSGLYQVPCDAKPPRFGITLGGKTFWLRDEDMVLPGYDGTGTGEGCIITVAPMTGFQLEGVGSGGILGDPFLKNVVSVYDMGKNEMRFAARKKTKKPTAKKDEDCDE
jgi:hypothetical protein